MPSTNKLLMPACEDRNFKKAKRASENVLHASCREISGIDISFNFLQTYVQHDNLFGAMKG